MLRRVTLDDAIVVEAVVQDVVDVGGLFARGRVVEVPCDEHDLVVVCIYIG